MHMRFHWTLAIASSKSTKSGEVENLPEKYMTDHKIRLTSCKYILKFSKGSDP